MIAMQKDVAGAHYTDVKGAGACEESTQNDLRHRLDRIRGQGRAKASESLSGEIDAFCRMARRMGLNVVAMLAHGLQKDYAINGRATLIDNYVALIDEAITGDAFADGDGQLLLAAVNVRLNG